MKIIRMALPAYGPFTDLIIDFAGGPKDFHLIYGSNEAGKSSALRALRRMLFGIPVRKSDSFLHPNPRLRIGARLVRSDGVEIEFVRRKGQSKTLRGPDDETLLDDDALVGLLADLLERLYLRLVSRQRLGDRLYEALYRLLTLAQIAASISQDHLERLPGGLKELLRVGFECLRRE